MSRGSEWRRLRNRLARCLGITYGIRRPKDKGGLKPDDGFGYPQPDWLWPRTPVLAGDCLLWRWQVNPDGYGKMGDRLAHREAWRQTRRQDVPKGKSVLHLCHRRICFQPSHLYLGTHTDNSRDRTAQLGGLDPINEIARVRTPGLSDREWMEGINSELARKGHPALQYKRDMAVKIAAASEHVWTPVAVEGRQAVMQGMGPSGCFHIFETPWATSKRCSVCGERGLSIPIHAKPGDKVILGIEPYLAGEHVPSREVMVRIMPSP